VIRLVPDDPNFGSVFDLFSVTFKEPWVIQRFLPRITEGDKRIILVEGEPLGAVNRVPAVNDLRSNMVRGGAANATELTEREREICATIGPELKARGLILVGIDVIDGNLTEINVTSPTGIRAIRRLGGPDIAAAVWDAIEGRLGRS
jgi:glutathione synthase